MSAFRAVALQSVVEGTLMTKAFSSKNRFRSLISLLGAGVLSVVALYFLYSQFHSSVSQQHILFVDEETGQEYQEPVNLAPPLPNSQGHLSLVRGAYFSYDQGKTHFLGYMEKYTPAAKKALDQGREQTLSDNGQELMAVVGGLLIRSPAPGSPWVNNDSPEAQQIHVLLEKNAQASGGTLARWFP
jgi:hypothetical protein